MHLLYPNDYYIHRNSIQEKKRYEEQLKYLPKLTNEKILDVGCARGDFLEYLKKIYPSIVTFGVDPFSDYVNNSVDYFCSKHLYEANYKENYFDLITSWAVFEHLTEPNKYFKEVFRILKHGGKFVFLVTNADSFWSRYAYMEDVPRHLYHFTEKTLFKYSGNNGFKMNKCVYDNSIFDGRGFGTINFFIAEIFGINWERRLLGFKIGLLKKIIFKIFGFLDNFIFRFNWESKFKKSGIIIVEFIKE